MPKYFCDYCDVYLTHDSMSVRKAHNSGRNHLRNVIDYYQQIGHEKAQNVIDSITNSYAAEGQSGSNPMLPQNQPGGGGVGAFPGAPGFPPPGFPPPMGGPFGAAAPPPGMPPLPPGFPPPGGRGMPPNFPPGAFPPPPALGPNGMPPFPPNMPPMPPGGPAGSPPAGMNFPPPPGFAPPPGGAFPMPGGPSPVPGHPGMPPHMSPPGHGMGGGLPGGPR